MPIGREGNKVFARGLRPGEADTGEVVKLEAGDQLVIPAGAITLDSREIDAESPEGPGGYAPIANTVWTWYQIAPVRAGFFLHLFSLARRTDSAHALWALAVEERQKAEEEVGIARRARYFSALATSEMAIIALHRALVMVEQLNSKFALALDVPESLAKVRPAVEGMRHAFEHIDERAEGKVNLAGEIRPEALSVFEQTDFVESSVLRYGGYSLNLETEILSALLKCREIVMEAIDARDASGADKEGVAGY